MFDALTRAVERCRSVKVTDFNVDRWTLFLILLSMGPIKPE
jgi:hypothetical protein